MTLLEAIEFVTDVTPEQLSGRRRFRSFVIARAIYCRHKRDRKVGLQKIANSIGIKNHTSIIHLLNVYEADYKNNREFREMADRVKALINEQ